MASKLKSLTLKKFVPLLLDRQARFNNAPAELPEISDNAMALAKALHPKRQYLKVAEVKDMAQDTKSFTLVPDEERLSEALWQVREMCKDKPEKVAIAEARKHLAWYIKGLRGSAKVRNEIMKTQTYEQTERIISEYLTESRCCLDG